ncbi:MAG: multidrug resistance protein [Hyphomicrobiales bacterium]|nr:multidrug resistance protein [Hyphomicrobiales bacterium]
MSRSRLLTPGRWKLSIPSAGVYATAVAISFSAASSAPTPLYSLYQETMGLSPAVVTFIFAAYVLGMVIAFLTLGRLSDYVGRRPMILGALLVNFVALLMFIEAVHARDLAIARLLQGVATGVAMTSLGATIVDTQPRYGATLNGVTAFIGLTAGSLLAGVLIAWAPLPTKLVYAVLLAITLIEILVLPLVPETTTGKPGGLRALVPRISVPLSARGTMMRLVPLNVAAWALGGFYLSLMPSLVSAVTETHSPFLGATVVSTLVLTATVAVLVLRASEAKWLLRFSGLALVIGIAVTLLAVRIQSEPGMFFGTLIAGAGLGTAYFGSLRILIPLAGEHERAAMLAAYLVISYVAFSVPAIAAGLVAPRLSLVTTAYVYGAALIAMATMSLALMALASRLPAERVGRQWHDRRARYARQGPCLSAHTLEKSCE